MTLSRIVMMMGLIGLVAACSRGGGAPGETSLRNLRNNRATPEEFSIVPNKPLQQPESYAQLPAPRPGGANRTDQTPLGDAVGALGGNPAALRPGTGVPQGDVALVSRVSRYGRDGNIRATLAEEDYDFRRRKSILNWKLFPDDEYNRAYRRQRLDADDALRWFRARGVRTPSAPPEAN
ncbi:DUF3035 domain-containing protein [Salipiger mucosus]|uniref:Pyruvate/2-oxoglutarate dehydrogenase complex, dihydrolipoamide acyltransferase (E2) component n=1 Tax=Salipiger mucosus DSM 16094 TaxID=1123237 RepID=S9QE41_9RHOB|nr:DUF3035 domain-containing protein [Salipiger mucosus]EPX79711.1 Pyruvate/2-oxoglutarate dehydrogenase complex, dihydrolipoamide acyltransferase (E2) component [Salipiger mucosus DSM 16094]